MSDREDKELERVLKALANRRRLNIMRYVKGRREAPVGEIANHIKLSFKATSKHLSVLAAADLLQKEQRSVQMLYSVSHDLPDIVRRILS